MKLILAIPVFIFLVSCVEIEDTLPGIETRFEKSDFSYDEKIVVDENISGRGFYAEYGLVGQGFEFYDDSTFHYYSWCDICEGNHSWGNYTVKENTLQITDTIHYRILPHFAEPEDTIIFREHFTYELYIWRFPGWIELRREPQPNDNIVPSGYTLSFFPGDLSRPCLSVLNVPDYTKLRATGSGYWVSELSKP